MHALVPAVTPRRPSPAVVLVHGLGVSHRYFVPTAARLVREVPTYVPDLPGYGLSTKPPQALGIGGLADALAAWMDAARLRSAVLVGNSMGCQIVVDLAVRQPRRALGVVLQGPTVDPAARRVSSQVVRVVVDTFREPLSYIPIVVWDYLRSGVLRNAATFLSALEDPIAEKLAYVSAPALVVRGERDVIAPARWGEEAAERLPRGSLVTIPSAPHAANYAAPEELAGIILRFVHTLP